MNHPTNPTERGGLGRGLAIFIILLMCAIGACLAVADDNDQPNSLATTQTADHHHKNGGKCDDQCGNKNGNDCNNSQNCSDDDKIDFHPTICAVPNSCTIQPDPGGNGGST